MKNAKEKSSNIILSDEPDLFGYSAQDEEVVKQSFRQFVVNIVRNIDWTRFIQRPASDLTPAEKKDLASKKNLQIDYDEPNDSIFKKLDDYQMQDIKKIDLDGVLRFHVNLFKHQLHLCKDTRTKLIEVAQIISWLHAPVIPESALDSEDAKRQLVGSFQAVCMALEVEDIDLYRSQIILTLRNEGVFDRLSSEDYKLKPTQLNKIREYLSRAGHPYPVDCDGSNEDVRSVVTNYISYLHQEIPVGASVSALTGMRLPFFYFKTQKRSKRYVSETKIGAIQGIR